MTNFIYYLQIVTQQYENAFKIGCTDDFHERMPDYGTHLGPHEFKSDIIQIISVPDKIKVMFKGKLENYRLCNYAEAYLHSHYSDKRTCNPTTWRDTEFFIPQIKITNSDIEKILTDAGIQFKYTGLYDKNNHPERTTASTAKKKPSKPKEKKCDYDVSPESENQIYEDNCSGDGLDFIKNMVLRGKELRPIQDELWKTLSSDKENINGLIKWPTGTGKRIAIIMIIIILYLYYKSQDKPFRCVVAANRNDIFDGDAWTEYEMIHNIGLPVYKGSKGKLKEDFAQIRNKKSFLLVTTHQSLVKEDASKSLSKDGNILYDLNIGCMIYDETQNITSTKMYDYLKVHKPKHLIGISATPETDDEGQNEKIKELFNDKYLSTCTYKDAIDNEWINPCKFYLEKYTEDKGYILNKINTLIKWRIHDKRWVSKKFIIWVPTNTAKRDEYSEYFEKESTWKICNEISDFNKDNFGDEPMCLLLCQKGREGYDRKDIEFGVHIGDSGGHLYIQEQGRSMRKDYDGKISELLIFCSEDKMYELYDKIPKYMGDDYIRYLHDLPDEIRKDEEEEKQREELQRQITESQRKIAKLDEKQKIKEEEKRKERDEERDLLDDKKKKEFKLAKMISNDRVSSSGQEISEEVKKQMIIYLEIKSPQDLPKLLSNIKGFDSRLKTIDFDFIDWSEYDEEKKYYETYMETISSIDMIYKNNKSKLRSMTKRQDMQEFYNKHDNKIPSWDVTQKLWVYWGKCKCTEADFKLDPSPPN